MDNFEDQTSSSQNNNGKLEEETSNALQQCQNQLQEIKNKYLLTIADFENFKKRQEKERLQWTRVAQVEVVSPLLTIIDDFDRALMQKKEAISPEIAQWLTGFGLIHKELLKYLDKIGIKEIKVKEHEEFNPEFHESVMTVESEIPSGHIVAVLQKGYTFKDFVIRPAKVSIAR
jgi:molecular chaperone GrpE